MQHRKLWYILVVAAMLLGGGCRKAPDNARYIPADVTAVVGVNLRSLSKKIAWNLITGSKLYKEIRKRMPAKNAGDVMGGIENAGLDVSNTFYVYSRRDDRFDGGNIKVGLIPLEDAVKWEAYIHQAFPDAKIIAGTGRKEASLGTGMYAGWNNELLIIINAQPAAVDDEDADRMDDAPGNTLDIAKEMETAFMVPAGNTIMNNKRFSSFGAHRYDLSFWLDYGNVLTAYNDAGALDVGGVSLSSSIWKDAIVTAGFEFKKGRITSSIDYYLPEHIEEATRDFGEVEADRDMLDRLPKDNLDMLLSMHISPAGVKALLEKIGLFGIANVGLTTQGLDVDYVLNAFTGDMAIVMNDFSLTAEMQTDEFMGEQVVHKQQRAGMSMTYVVKINQEENFKKLVQFAEQDGMIKTANGYIFPLTSKDSVFMMIDGKYAIVSSQRKYAQGFLGGHFKKTPMKPAIAKRVYGYPFALTFDINQLFHDVDPAISNSPRDSAIIAESKKLLNSVTLRGGKYVDNAYKFDLDINFMNKDENSILELIDFGMRMNEISTRDEEE
ncbi:MAG: DUF4836 family protein [Taibaiella sp.]|nr:DUF4836 family protein [Taibaiella sp.]